MRQLLILTAVSVTAIMVSCTTSLKRYRSAGETATDSTLADADLFCSRITGTDPVPGSKTLLDLTAEAQAQFIRIMNVRYPDNGNFLNSLRFEFLPAGPGSRPGEYLEKDLRLVFSVSRKHAYEKGSNSPLISPADRLEYMKLSVVLDEPSIQFTGWNMYTTEYGSVEIGDVSFSKSLATDISATLPVQAGTRGGLPVATSLSLSRKEDQQVRYRYIRLNGKLNDTLLVMEEEGTRETDLTGNIIANVSVRFRTSQEFITNVRNIYDSSGSYNPPGKLRFENSVVEIPYIETARKEVGAKLILDYVYRNVVNGSKTFPEWDDRVKYYTGHREKHIVILHAADYVPGFYGIGTGQGNSKKDFVLLTGKDGKMFRLIFSSFGEADAFFDWLKEWLERNEGKPATAGGYLLKFGTEPLTKKFLDNNRFFGVMPCFW